jgi:alkylated DNA repair protein (DNA oxidative demethylase)
MPEPRDMLVLPKGVHLIPGYLDRAGQEQLRDEVRNLLAQAPLYVPQMPRTGKPMSVRMSNCGVLGWVTDRDGGYRYQAFHPVTGKPWPPMPDSLVRVWTELASYPAPAEACLINFYDERAKMGMHQDRDEADMAAPVVSISLGDTCRFRVGGPARADRTVSFDLASGDALILSGPGRLAYHGVDRIYPDTSSLLKNGGRINLTLRRVTKPV